MKQHRFLCMLTVCAMMLGLAGCGGNAENAETKAAVTEQTTHSADVTAAETKPENGDKDGNSEADVIRRCLYVDGKQVTLPCTLAEFGEGFEIRDDIWEDNSPQLSDSDFYYDESGNAVPSYQGTLWYGGVSWGMVIYTNADNGERVLWSVLIANWYGDNDYSRLKVNNEVYLGGDCSDLTEIKGLSYERNTNSYLAVFCTASDNDYETKLSIGVREDNTVGTINVNIRPKKNKRAENENSF